MVKILKGIVVVLFFLAGACIAQLSGYYIFGTTNSRVEAVPVQVTNAVPVVSPLTTNVIVGYETNRYQFDTGDPAITDIWYTVTNALYETRDVIYTNSSGQVVHVMVTNTAYVLADLYYTNQLGQVVPVLTTNTWMDIFYNHDDVAFCSHSAYYRDVKNWAWRENPRYSDLTTTSTKAVLSYRSVLGTKVYTSSETLYMFPCNNP